MVRVLFFGTPDFALPTLRALVALPAVKVGAVVTQPDRQAGRGGKVQHSPIKEFALQHSIPVLQPVKIFKGAKNFTALVTPYGPFHLGVVVAYGQILPREALEIPQSGCVNVHASLLPRWRGAAPIQRAILAGDKETGISLMKMDQGLDTGPVIATEKIEISDHCTAGELHDALAEIGAQLLAKHLNSISHGALISTPQTETGVTYAEKIIPADAAIDWSQDSIQLSRLVRAMSPFPGAYTQLTGKRLKILAATPKPALLSGSPSTPAGTVSFCDRRALEVTCGVGILSILELQLEGKKRLSIEEFLKGHPIEVGAVLG